MASHSSTLAWKIPWMEEPGRLQSTGSAKSQTRLSDFTLTFHFHALEKEMTTHSSVLAWRIPGMAEPGGLPSMGSHRVGYDWSNLAAAAAGGKEFTCNTGDVGSIPGLGRSPGDSIRFVIRHTKVGILSLLILAVWTWKSLWASPSCFLWMDIILISNFKNYEFFHYLICFYS